MRRSTALVLAAALAAPVLVAAQQWTPPGADENAGRDAAPGAESTGDLFERGLENLMQNMLREAEPHLNQLGRDLGNLGNSLGPVFGDIGALMDDVKNYQAPERLENGDILIRRRADAPPPPPVGNTLRNLLRPAPGDDPRQTPQEGDPPRSPDRVLPEPDPEAEIEL